MPRMLRTRQVIRATGLSRTTIWRLEKRGDFPKRRILGPNCVAWLRSEIDQWLETRPFKDGDNDKEER